MSEIKMEALKKPSLLGLFSNPSEQFERLRERPVIGIPMVIVFLMMMAGTVLSVAGTDFAAEIEEYGGAVVDLQTVEVMGWIFGIIGTIFNFLAVIFLGALIYWVCAKIAGSSAKYKQMLSMALFTSFISVFGMVIHGFVVFFTDVDPKMVVTSLKSLIPAEEPVASILAPFEVFGIWTFVLLAIGFQNVAGLSKKASWTITIILFALIVLFSFLGGVYTSFIGSFEGNV